MFLLVAATSCSMPGSGSAERVNVPLSVTLTLTKPATSDCNAKRCTIHYRAVVTDEGSQAVYGRDCVVRALDPTGRSILQTPVALGFPAGAYTEPGSPFQENEVLPLPIPRPQAARVSTLSGSCLAFIWHGTTPI